MLIQSFVTRIYTQIHTRSSCIPVLFLLFTFCTVLHPHLIAKSWGLVASDDWLIKSFLLLVRFSVRLVACINLINILGAISFKTANGGISVVRSFRTDLSFCLIMIFFFLSLSHPLVRSHFLSQCYWWVDPDSTLAWPGQYRVCCSVLATALSKTIPFRF